MNYLRGAVSAISAPYQYYRDLNPSTLTGAIDVIVISRPKQRTDSDNHDDAQDASQTSKDDETELLCSPFHVRFGKWQVLRPGDKKVDVFVNGNHVPFPMKIGEAGEAFFVFEADGEVPDDLVTSPLLEATHPGHSNGDTEVGRFGSKEDGSGPQGQPEGPSAVSQEPDFLDLDASPQNDISRQESSVTEHQSGDTGSDRALESGPTTFLSRTAQLGKAVLNAAIETEKSQQDKIKDTALRDAFSAEQPSNATEKGDSAVSNDQTDKGHAQAVQYNDDVVLDMEGYHSKRRQHSDDTLTSRDLDAQPFTSERTPRPSSEFSHDDLYLLKDAPSGSPSPPSSPETYASDAIAFPSMRATSEPPPDTFSTLSTPSPSTQSLSHGSSTTEFPRPKLSPRTALRPLATSTSGPETEAYMWDWGGFPQKTPVQTTFSPRISLRADDDGEDKLAPRYKGKGRLERDDSVEIDDDQLPERHVPNVSATSRSSSPRREAYGAGGRLFADHRDPKRFKVLIEGRTVDFELAIVDVGDREEHMTRGERPSGPLGGFDEVEDARRFEEGKISFAHFMADENLVKDPNLVLKWAGDQYITRQDASPLMDSLVIWREAALKHRYSHRLSRSMSSGFDSDRGRLQEVEEEDWSSDDRANSKRDSAGYLNALQKSSTQIIDGKGTSSRKPSSSSWVRWWSRSKQAENARPDLKPANSAPSEVERNGAHVSDQLPPVKRSSSAASEPVFTQSRDHTLFVNTATDGQDATPKGRKKKYAKTLRLTSDQLKSLNLKPGANTITFSLSATGVTACTARLFVWDHTDLIVVSDIDGTITKSDALGHVFTMIGRDWTHLGVAKLYTDICRNGYKMLYLTSRAIGQADSTRDYLKGIKQNDYQLPEGPVIMSPDRLMASLHREVIMRKPEVFKMACLRDIRRLFGQSARNPFYAGFGNRITDALSYRSVDVPSSRIFTIDSSGEVKMELLELAGYKSSYIHMTDLVDQMFPPIHKKWAAEYTDFNYWKAPVQDFPLPDLSPPSPALSARSDTSNQSTLARLRNFSLVPGRQTTNGKQSSLPHLASSASGKEDAERKRESQLRQMSSLERLSNTLVAFAQSSSTVGSAGGTTPTYVDSGSEDEDDGSDLEKGRPRRRRTRSMSSMPGSLPGSADSSDDEEIHFGRDDDGGEYEGGDEEEAAEEAFDEDFLATGEMEKVPFL